MSTPGKASGVKGAPQGLKVPLTGSESQDLMKPIVFGNHQKQFKIFSAVVSAAMTYYLVFHHDFGPKRHVFSWVRGYLLQSLNQSSRIARKLDTYMG